MSLPGLPVLSAVTGLQLLDAFVKNPDPVAQSPWDIYTAWRTETGNDGYDTPTGDFFTTAQFINTGIFSLQGGSDGRIAISPGGMLALFRVSFSATSEYKIVTTPEGSSQIPVAEHIASNRAPAVALVAGPPGSYRRHRSNRRFKDTNTNTQYLYVKWTDYFSVEAEPVEAAFKINTGRIEFYVRSGAANTQQSYVQLFRFDDTGTSYLSAPGGGAFTDPLVDGVTSHYISEPVVGPVPRVAFVSASSPLGGASIRSSSDHANWVTPLDATSQYEVRDELGNVLFSGNVTPWGGAMLPISARGSENPYASAVATFSPIQSLGAVYTPLSGWAFLDAPSPRLTAIGRSSLGDYAANLTAPSPSLSANGGANARLLRAPMQTLEATATGTNWGTVSVTAPSATLSSTGTVSAMGGASLLAPMATLVGYSGAVCLVTLTGKAQLQASGTTGSIGGAQLTAPLFELTASGTMENYGSANLLAPSPKLGGQGQAWLIAPVGRLTAIGTAVVAVAYEAYATNLLHASESPDEVTRYTNYPFTHIVRYQNSYYGANSTGLYLLEGTTDDGTPIAYDIETHPDTLGHPGMKTAVSAYLSGRIDPELTATVVAGEDNPQTYSYDSPRGATAQTHRVKFGRGVKDRYLAFGLAGEGVLELDGIELEINNLKRRI